MPTTNTAGSPQTFNYTGSSQTFTAGAAGIYHIEVDGAAGGSTNGGNAGGSGAIVSGDIYLQAGAKLQVVVGGQGERDQRSGGAGGGGGGSFAIETFDGMQMVQLDEVIAGGGGGGGGRGGGGGGRTVGSGGNGGGSNAGSGGMDGAAGTGGRYSGGGGGGRTGGSGGDSGSTAGTTFAGGSGVQLNDPGGGAGGSPGGAGGGYGGGGGDDADAGGGGGGYGGGGGGSGTQIGGGGGGGSYVNTAAVSNVTKQAGAHGGNGLVIIDAEPSVMTSGGAMAESDQVPVAVDAGVTVSDLDNTTLASATVKITGNFEAGEDVLGFTNTSADGNIGGTYDAQNGTLTLTSAGATATTAQFQAALQSVTYDDTSDTPNTADRTISFTVNDGTLDSAVATKTVSVAAGNEPPTLSATGTNPTFTETPGAGTQAAPVVVFTDANASTVESGQTITGLTFTVGGLADSANETVQVDGTTIALGAGSTGTTAANQLGYTVTVNGTTATVALANAGGVSTATADAVIDGISYQDTNLDDPTAGQRTVTITQITDSGGTANGGSDTTAEAIGSTVTVVPVNDLPVLTNATDAVSYLEAGTAVVLNPGLSVTDPELTPSGSFGSASLTLVRDGGANAADVFGGSGDLSLTAGVATISDKAIGTYADTDGTFVLTFNNAATNADVNTALQSVTYATSGHALPASVQIDDTFSDGNTGAQGTGGALTAAGDTVISVTVAAPSKPVLDPGSDTGTSQVDGVTKKNSGLVFTGMAEADTLVTVYDGGTAIGTAMAGDDGVYAVTEGGTLSDGAHQISATATNGAMVTSLASTATSITIDTTAPTVAVTSQGGPTNQASQTITGTVDVADAGTTVSLFDNGGATADGTAQVQANGAFTIPVTLAQGSNALVAKDTDAAGNTGTSNTVTYTLDTTAPTITSDTATPAMGDFGAGKTVTFTLATSEAVTVTGTPTLTLNDGGGSATYDAAASSSTSLVFTTTTAAGQNAATLAVTGVNLPNGATIQDAAGNNADLAGAGATFNGLEVDTTAPAVSSPTVTVAQNAGATPIGIAAPSDNLTPAGSLAIVAGNLPSDGTLTLSDGMTAVTSGETLTAAQLTGLAFTPTPGAANQGSTFTYSVTDGAGNVSTGTAALDIGAAGAPTLAGTHASSTSAEAPVMPFTGVVLADPNRGTDTLTIMLENGGGTLAGTGLVVNTDGSYTLSGSAATVTQQLDALSFTPTAPPAGTSATTTFVLSDATSAGTSVTDAGTSVTDSAVGAPPPPPAPDTISIDPNAAFVGHGTFVLTGEVSSPAGVKPVEISARVGGVDGVETDLGSATVNANGTFTFEDKVGAHVQGFITATETDDAGGTASDSPLTSLRAGIQGQSYHAIQDFYTAGGNREAAAAFEQNDGHRTVVTESNGQTLTSQFHDTFANQAAADTTFVFDPGFGHDTIKNLLYGGPNHDTIALPSADFASFAQVLRDTQNTSNGALIHENTSGDTLLLAGVSKGDLAQHKTDFSFHA